jgi:hypothetical protein
MTTTKQQLRIEAQIVKAEQATADRLARLKARLINEQVKVRQVTIEMDGVKQLLEQVETFATANQVSNQKVLDFISKQIVGPTAKVVFRQPRASKVKKEPSSPATKVPAKKK